MAAHYEFWKRYDVRKNALAEAKKLRKMGKQAKVVHYDKSPFNWDVYVKVGF